MALLLNSTRTRTARLRANHIVVAAIPGGAGPAVQPLVRGTNAAVMGMGATQPWGDVATDEAQR